MRLKRRSRRNLLGLAYFLGRLKAVVTVHFLRLLQVQRFLIQSHIKGHFVPVRTARPR